MGIPLLSHSDPASPVARRGADAITVSAFLADVAALAGLLPARGHVVNLCADRYRFTVGFAAALVRGQVSLLPSSVAPGLLRDLAHSYPGSYALADTAVPDCTLDLVRYPDRLSGPSHHEVPEIEPDRIAAIAFTSGSTGRPAPHAKSWGGLVAGAHCEAEALGLRGASGVTLVGTVPAQHMYGLESTVLLALQNGLALHAQRPFYPADIRAVLDATPGERILVTTPVHLRALLAEEHALAPLRLILCATAPLSARLAAQAEQRYGAPLLEIYGFTEAGQVAWRRTTAGVEWHALPGVRPRSDAQGVWFSGTHIDEEALSGDLIELLAADRFVLRGRGRDLINVAGKRTSLGYLNHQLAAIEGVEDAAVFVPEETGESVTRLAAFVVAPHLTRERLLARLRSRIDPAFLPRPLYFVERLPRNATGKLSRQALETLARTCASRGRGGQSSLIRLLASDHPAADGHFPADPIIPGAVILDEVVAAAEAQFGLGPSAWTVRHAKFLSPLRPGEALVIRFRRSADADVRFECAAGSRAVASGTLRPGAAEA